MEVRFKIKKKKNKKISIERQKQRRTYMLMTGLIFLLGFGAYSRVTAFGANITPDYDSIESFELFPTNPADNSLIDIQSAEEACIVSSAKSKTTSGLASGGSTGSSSGASLACCNQTRLVGIIPGTFLNFPSKVWGGNSWDSFNCKLKNAKATGDVNSFLEWMDRKPRGLTEMLNDTNAKIIHQKPLSGVGYIEEKATAVVNLGDVKAQSYYYPGTGYDLLQPIQGFWGWSVNIVFGFLTVLIIIVAIGIMFRSKLGGAQVVTLQNAIPSIAMAMILVPLSYAISGLFIDAITLGTNVTHQFLLGEGSPAREVYVQRNTIFDPNKYGFGNVPDRGLYADDSRVSWLLTWKYINTSDEINDVTETGINEIGSESVLNFVDKVISLIDPSRTTADWLGTLINFIIQLALFISGLRIFMALIKKYIYLVLYPVASPFIFATVALPGRGTSMIMDYVNTMLSAAVTFIAAYALTLLTMIISTSVFQSDVAQIQQSQYVPPLLAIGPLINGVNDNEFNFNSFMFLALALILYVQIPTMLAELDAIFKVAPMPKFLGAAAATLRADLQTVRNAPGEARRVAWQGIDTFDKLRGKKPGDYGSVRSIASRRLSGLGARADVLRDRGGIVGNVGGRLLGAGATAARNIAGPEFNSTNNRGNRALEAKVEIVYGGRKAEGELVLKRAEIEAYCRTYERQVIAGAPISPLAKGTISLVPKDWVLPVQISPETIRVRTSTPVGNTTPTRKAGDNVPLAHGVDIFGLETKTGGSIKTEVELGAGFVYSDNGPAELEFNIIVNDIIAAFGYRATVGVPGTGIIDDTLTSVVNLRGGVAKTDKIFFTIDGVTTPKPIGFTISIVP